MARAILGKEPLLLPADCMLGALSRYIADGSLHDFQPMGANMGILPPWPERVKDKTLRYEKIAERGLSHRKNIWKRWINKVLGAGANQNSREGL